MIEPNATQIKAQAIEIHRSGSGYWNVYDAKGRFAGATLTRDNAVELARIKFSVRPSEWRTLAVECACKGEDFCRRCGGHGELYRTEQAACSS